MFLMFVESLGLILASYSLFFSLCSFLGECKADKRNQKIKKKTEVYYLEEANCTLEIILKAIPLKRKHGILLRKCIPGCIGKIHHHVYRRTRS
jgi:hypothetical protein